MELKIESTERGRYGIPEEDERGEIVYGLVYIYITHFQISPLPRRRCGSGRDRIKHGRFTLPTSGRCTRRLWLPSWTTIRGRAVGVAPGQGPPRSQLPAPAAIRRLPSCWWPRTIGHVRASGGRPRREEGREKAINEGGARLRARQWSSSPAADRLPGQRAAARARDTQVVGFQAAPTQKTSQQGSLRCVIGPFTCHIARGVDLFRPILSPSNLLLPFSRHPLPWYKKNAHSRAAIMSAATRLRSRRPGLAGYQTWVPRCFTDGRCVTADSSGELSSPIPPDLTG